MKEFFKVFVAVFCFCICFTSHVFSHSKEPFSKKKLSKVLNILNWEDYFGETTISEFEKRFGVKVNLETLQEEEEIFSSLQSAPEKYDIVVVSGGSIDELSRLRLITEIDFKNIPNLKNIDKVFLNPHYDKEQKFSVPYLWGVTGVVVNTKFIKNYEESWSVLWDKKYKDKIAMLNNLDETMGSALKYIGYSLNTVSEQELEQVSEKLIEQKDILKGYLTAYEIRDMLISEELWCAQQYSGEGMFAVDKNENLDFFIPKEGGPMWVDCFAISRDAEHKYTAEVFINFILEPKVGAEITNYLWYANCNKAADKYIEKEILESPEVYPTEEVLAKCEFFIEMGSEEERNRTMEFSNKLWAELNK